MRRRLGLVFLVLSLVLAVWATQLQAFVDVQVTQLLLVEKGVLTAPAGLAFRPDRPQELWVTNQGNDSLAIVDLTNPDLPVALVRTDAYAEHFVAHPAEIAFGVEDTFASRGWQSLVKPLKLGRSLRRYKGLRPIIVSPGNNETFLDVGCLLGRLLGRKKCLGNWRFDYN